MEENNISNWNNNPISNGRTYLGDDTVTFNSQYHENLHGALGYEWDFLDWLTGKDKQVQNQAYEMTMQERQWAYDDPTAQMERMKRAGINPNLAASGISGGNQSAQAPSSPVSSGNGADVLGQAANIIGSAASGFGSVANGLSELGQLEGRKNKLRAEYGSILEDMGLTKLKSKALSIEIEYLPEKERLAVTRALYDIENVQEQTNVYKQQVANMKEEIDEIRSRIDLNKELGNQANQIASEAEMRTKMLELQQFEQKWTNDFISQYGINPNHPIMQQLSSLVAQGRDDMVSRFFDMISDYQYNLTRGNLESQAEYGYQAAYAMTSGEQRALVENAFDLAYNKSQGDLPADLSKQEFQNFLDKNKEFVKGYVAILSHISKNPVEMANQVAALAAFAQKQGVLEQNVDNPSKPSVPRPSTASPLTLP